MHDEPTLTAKHCPLHESDPHTSRLGLVVLPRSDQRIAGHDVAHLLIVRAGRCRTRQQVNSDKNCPDLQREDGESFAAGADWAGGPVGQAIATTVRAKPIRPMMPRMSANDGRMARPALIASGRR